MDPVPGSSTTESSTPASRGASATRKFVFCAAVAAIGLLLAIYLFRDKSEPHPPGNQGDDRDVALAASGHPGLLICGLGPDGSWSAPAAWDGRWSNVDPAWSMIACAADGRVPIVFDPSQRSRQLEPLRLLGSLSISVHGAQGSLFGGERVTVRRQSSLALLGLSDDLPKELSPALLAESVVFTGHASQAGAVDVVVLPDADYSVALDQDVEARCGIRKLVATARTEPGRRRVVAFHPRDDVARGWLETEFGEPCPNAKVRLVKWRSGDNVSLSEDAQVVYSAANGAFFLDSPLPSGSLKIDGGPMPESGLVLWIEWKPADEGPRCRYLDLSDGLPLEFGRIELGAGLTLNVDVTRGGVAAGGAKVQLWVDERIRLAAETDAAGQARFAGLPPGLKYQCVAETDLADREVRDVSELLTGPGAADCRFDFEAALAMKRQPCWIEVDREGSGLPDLSAVSLMACRTDEGLRDHWSGERLNAGHTSSSLLFGGTYLVWAMPVDSAKEPQRISRPFAVKIADGETVILAFKFELAGVLKVTTSVPFGDALVFAGLRTAEGFHMAGDAELTGEPNGDEKRRATGRTFYVPPGGTYKIQVYVRTYDRQYWHTIELPPFEPGEQRELVIDKFWD